MEEIKPRFYKISEVATRWNKTINEILLMMEHGKLKAFYRYNGFYFYGSKKDEFVSMADLPEEEIATLSGAMEAIEGVFGKISNVGVCRATPSKGERTICPTKYYSSVDGLCADGFFTLSNYDASLLRLSGEASIGLLNFHMELLPGLSLGLPFDYSFLYVAIETQFDGKPAWRRGTHKVKVDDLCFVCLEIARIEKENHSLFVQPEFTTPVNETLTEDPKDHLEMTNLAANHAKALQKENHPGWKPTIAHIKALKKGKEQGWEPPNEGGWVLYLTEWIKENAPKNWLQKNAPKNVRLTNNACKRIATIANQDRSVGPGTTKG